MSPTGRRSVCRDASEGFPVHRMRFTEAARTLRLRTLLILCLGLLLTACGDNGGSGSGSRVTYSVGGTVNGLVTDGLVLELNGADDDPVTAYAQSFEFSEGLANGQAWAVSVKSSPPSQQCTVAAPASGTVAGADVTQITINCLQSFAIGGTTSGLVTGSKTPLQLKYTPSNSTQQAQTLSILADGSWAFSPVLSGTQGMVAVATQPAALDQICLLQNATPGAATSPSVSVPVTVGSAPITTLQVTCNLSPGYTGTAVISGLPTTLPSGSSPYNVIVYLTVTDIHGDQQVGKMVPPVGGALEDGTSFQFLCNGSPCAFTDGSSYQASIEQPTVTNGLIPEHCVLANKGSSGVIAEADIQVEVQCTPVARFLYVAAGTNTAAGTVVPYTIDASTGALTLNGSAVPTGVEPTPLTLQPSTTPIDPNHPPSTPAFAYLVNYESSTLNGYTISYSTGAIAAMSPASVSTPEGPWESGGVPQPFDGNFLYVTGNAAQQIQAYSINPTTGAPTAAGAPVATGNDPWGNVVFAPGGEFAYQINANDFDCQIYSVDTSTGALTPDGTPISLIGPLFLTIDPTGKFAYFLTNTLPEHGIQAFQIDASTGQLTQIQSYTSDTGVGSANLTDDSRPIAIDPSDTYAFVLNNSDSSLSAFQIHADGSLSSAPGSPFQPGYWLQPTAIVFSPGGRFVYVLAQGSDNIAAYAVNLNPTNGQSALTLVGLYPVGSFPEAMAIDPSGSFLYVGNIDSNNISAFYVDANSGALSSVVGSPFALPSGSTAAQFITIVP